MAWASAAVTCAGVAPAAMRSAPTSLAFLIRLPTTPTFDQVLGGDQRRSAGSGDAGAGRPVLDGGQALGALQRGVDRGRRPGHLPDAVALDEVDGGGGPPRADEGQGEALRHARLGLGALLAHAPGAEGRGLDPEGGEGGGVGRGERRAAGWPRACASPPSHRGSTPSGSGAAWTGASTRSRRTRPAATTATTAATVAVRRRYVTDRGYLGRLTDLMIIRYIPNHIRNSITGGHHEDHAAQRPPHPAHPLRLRQRLPRARGRRLHAGGHDHAPHRRRRSSPPRRRPAPPSAASPSPTATGTTSARWASSRTASAPRCRC